MKKYIDIILFGVVSIIVVLCGIIFNNVYAAMNMVMIIWFIYVMLLNSKKKLVKDK